MSKNNTNVIGISLLNNFSEKEMDGFSHFAACLHFNTDKYVLRLLQILRRDVLGKRQFDEEVKNGVYEKVFSDKVTAKGLNIEQRKRLSAKLTGLTRLAERFLAVEALEENKVYRSDLVCQKLLEKKQYLLFNRIIRKEEKTLTAQPEKGWIYHSLHYQLAKNVMNYLHQTGEISKEDNMPKVLYYMDMRHFLEKLSLYVTMLFKKGKHEQAYDTAPMEITLQLLDLPQYTDQPMLQVYKATIQLIKNQNETAYRQLLDLLECNTSYIPKADLHGFYATLTNFCIRQISKGQFGYQDLFELYQTIEAKNLLLEGDFVSSVNLKSATICACRIGEFEWARELVEKYKPLIRKPIQESVYHFNVGVIAFYRKNYTAALHHFIRVDDVNTDYDINCRIMLMKSHYETDEDYDERTVQIFRAAEKFFKENKHLSPTRKRGYKNFIRILIYAYKFRHLSTKMSLESIKERLDKQDVNSDRIGEDWRVKAIPKNNLSMDKMKNVNCKSYRARANEWHFLLY